MLYAKVVLGIPVDGPFDYIVPAGFIKKIKPGSRARVSFGTRKMLGYVVALTQHTTISKLKDILEVIDDYPVLSRDMLLLTKELSEYYCCSWGEAIESALPRGLRKGRKIPGINSVQQKIKNHNETRITLVHDLKGSLRWDFYAERIKNAVDKAKSVLLLFPDIHSVLNAKDIIAKRIGCTLSVLYRKQAGELNEWVKIKQGKINVVIGTRAAIFAPFDDLGLIIIDEEQDSIYKQDQVPHYNAREVAFMLARIKKAELILGSASPSLESFYLAKKNKIKHMLLSGKEGFAQVKVIDMRSPDYRFRKKKFIFSKYLEDSIYSVLNSGGKALLFLNRKGFATSAHCLSCGTVLKCSRCNANLIYHSKDDILTCPYCNFKMAAAQICPSCHSGYIKYSGIGTEKIEDHLAMVFPQAKVKRLERADSINLNDAQIFISTSSILRQAIYLELKINFDLTAVLAIDNLLNRPDFRCSEKAFYLLLGLISITKNRLIIQTQITGHHCFQALVNSDIASFYNKELAQRKELGFPPYRHMALVKLRGRKEEQVKSAASALFEKLKDTNKERGIKIISFNRGEPAKLRGNFYWQILIICRNPKKASAFLKLNLKKFSHSGIIITVDVDPV